MDKRTFIPREKSAQPFCLYIILSETALEDSGNKKPDQKLLKITRDLKKMTMFLFVSSIIQKETTSFFLDSLDWKRENLYSIRILPYLYLFLSVPRP